MVMASMSLPEQSIGSSLQLKEVELNAPNMKGAMTFSQTTLNIMTTIRCRGTQHNNIWHNEIQRNEHIGDTHHDDTQHNSIECRFAECHIFIVQLNVFMLSVVAPITMMGQIITIDI
jgi:hypothetical protein